MKACLYLLSSGPCWTVATAGMADEQVRLALRQAVRRRLVTRGDLPALAAQRRGRIRHLVVEALKEEGAT